MATWNIRNGRALDGFNSWPFRRSALAAAIADLDADLVALQEAYGFQQRLLLARLTAFSAAGTGRDDGRERGERCAVLYRRSRLELVRQTTRWFSDDPDLPGSRGWGNPLPRIVTLAWFHDLAADRRFGLANAHWDGASAASRVRSAEALLTWLEPGLPWIVAGDLNATVDDAAVQRLLAAGLTDVLDRLDAAGPGVATHHGFSGATDGTRIDYILVSGEWHVEAAGIEHPRPGGRLPSDHWPVVAHLRWV